MPKKKSLRNRLVVAATKLNDAGYRLVPMVETEKGKRATCAWKEGVPFAKVYDDIARGATSFAVDLSRSNLIDVEYDNDAGKAAFAEMFGEEVNTPTFESGRGRHHFYKRPKGLPKKAVLHLDGIEFRIGNGSALSIVPPSKHTNGMTRAWMPGKSIHEMEPAELPEDIADRLREDATKKDPLKIPQGKRNDTLFARVCSLRAAGLSDDVLLSAVLDLNRRLCDPPLPEDEVERLVKSAEGSNPLVGFVERLCEDIELWHCADSEPYATVPQEDHRENWRIGHRGGPFKKWLAKLYYDKIGNILKQGFLAEVVAMLEGRAIFEGPKYQVCRRVGQHDDSIYIDMADAAWRAIEVDPDGWRIVDDPPVRFVRAKAVLPLPPPVETPGTELKQLLWPFLNVREEQWILIAAWLAAALRATGPYPILKLLGEQGSCKTTVARILRLCIDPNSAPVRAEPRSTRDLAIAANASWVMVLDNLSSIKADLSDALCRLSTGGGFATRQLYSDAEETIFQAQRPAILTSIEEIGTRSDLLERSLIVELPRIRKGHRRAEKEFWREFEEVRPQILGALLDVVSGALRRLPEIEAEGEVDLPRLADFYQWGQAIEVPLGLEPGTFAEAFKTNQDVANQVVLESSPFLGTLLKYIELNGSIVGTATFLHTQLGLFDLDAQSNQFWPKSARTASAVLLRAAPNLRAFGLRIEQRSEGQGNSKRKVWSIKGYGRNGGNGRKIADKVSGQPEIAQGDVRQLLAKRKTTKSNSTTKRRRRPK